MTDLQCLTNTFITIELFTFCHMTTTNLFEFQWDLYVIDQQSGS